MNPGELAAAGTKIDRIIDMKTGWMIQTTGPYAAAGRQVYVSLEFERDRLRRIGLSFCDRPDLDLTGLFDEHSAFLQQELGSPAKKTNTSVIYNFGWGTISAELDLRGGSSQIMCV
jgi:hypothetical protein